MKINMVEAIKKIDIGGEILKTEPVIKFSGSLQDGHFLRNSFWQLQRELSSFLPGIYMRYIPNHQDVTQGWLIRRDMRRISRDGRR